MIWVLVIFGLVYVPVIVGIGGSLYRIANAIEAQNKYYDIYGKKHGS